MDMMRFDDLRMRLYTEVRQGKGEGLGNVSLVGILTPVLAIIGDPETAIKAALQIPGCGLTYASKLLRLLQPDMHASLDGRIRKAMLKAWLLNKIYDSNENSMVQGYVAFQAFCVELVAQLDAAKIPGRNATFRQGRPGQSGEWQM